MLKEFQEFISKGNVIDLAVGVIIGGAFGLIVKSLTEEGSAGISSASIVHTDAKLLERIEFIHSATKSAAIAEEFIDGREMYVGVMGNDSTRAFPAWEFSMTKKDPDRPLEPDSVRVAPTGGNSMASANAELRFPSPFFRPSPPPITKRRTRGSSTS